LRLIRSKKLLFWKNVTSLGTTIQSRKFCRCPGKRKTDGFRGGA